MIDFDEVVDTLAEKQAKIFTTLDLRSGFWQMRLDPESAEKTAFTGTKSRYSFKRVPYGLKGASIIFSAMMHKILRSCLFEYAVPYIDDTLIFSSSMKDHLKHLAEVFKLFRQANLRLNPSKCHFATPKVRYLGYLISKDGLECDPEKIKNMQNFPRPTSVKTLKSYLGVLAFYRRFVRSFSQLASPLYALLKKDAVWNWTDECEKSFIQLKEALTKHPILRMPDLNKEFILITDASKQAISYTLLQADENNILHPISYGGRMTSKSEGHYTASELELLAIITGIKQYHTFLSGRRFKCLTDHVSLTFLKSLGQGGNSRLLRWSLFLMGYNIQIEHIAGRLNTLADLQSRREYPEENNNIDVEKEFDNLLFAMNDLLDEETLPPREKKETVLIELTYNDKNEKQTKLKSEAEVNAVDEEQLDEQEEIEGITAELFSDIALAQRLCEDFKDIIAYIEDQILPEDNAKARKIILESENYTISEGKLISFAPTKKFKNKRSIPCSSSAVYSRLIPEGFTGSVSFTEPTSRF